jgi:hypothetical protein
VFLLEHDRHDHPYQLCEEPNQREQLHVSPKELQLLLLFHLSASDQFLKPKL